MSAKIINRGHGPEIEGSRITVYDVMDYTQQGWHRDCVAALFRLSSQDIPAALDDIATHEEFERLGIPHHTSDRDLWQGQDTRHSI